MPIAIIHNSRYGPASMRLADLVGQNRASQQAIATDLAQQGNDREWQGLDLHAQNQEWQHGFLQEEAKRKERQFMAAEADKFFLQADRFELMGDKAAADAQRKAGLRAQELAAIADRQVAGFNQQNLLLGNRQNFVQQQDAAKAGNAAALQADRLAAAEKIAAKQAEQAAVRQEQRLAATAEWKRLAAEAEKEKDAREEEAKMQKTAADEPNKEFTRWTRAYQLYTSALGVHVHSKPELTDYEDAAQFKAAMQAHNNETATLQQFQREAREKLQQLQARRSGATAPAQIPADIQQMQKNMRSDASSGPLQLGQAIRVVGFDTDGQPLIELV
jgi:hypothetical protein